MDISELTEERLALMCREADPHARRTLYERYGGLLMTICVRYTGDPETARDVLHDGFIRIFQSMDKFTYQGEGSLKAWLSRVIVNEALGYLRRQSLKTQQEVVLDEIPDMEMEADEVNNIPQKVLMKLIGELPEGYRKVFNLYVFEEKSHKEIGELLGITEHTSSSQFYRAKSLLIKKIKEYRKKYE